jgi:DnaA family protein
MKGLQLPLGVQLSDTASFDSYHPGPNTEAAASVRQLLRPSAPPLVFLYGPAGSGKTHLLQALTRDAAAARLSCAYVPLRQLGADAADALGGLQEADVVGVDDVDALAADAAGALVLLRLLDALKSHGGRALLSAPAAPERLAIALPDLATRLAAGAVYGLKPLTDEDRLNLLRWRARGRGLELPDEAAQHLIERLARDVPSLLAALDSLDRASLSAKRRLTLPFVQQWLRNAH